MGSVKYFIETNAKNGNQIMRHTIQYLEQTVGLVHLTMFCRLVTVSSIRSDWTQP